MLEILFDCDDILIDTVPHWLNAIDEKFGIKKYITDVTDWDITKSFSKEILEGKITKECIHDVLSDDNYWRNISRIPKMYTLLRNLKIKYGDDIKLSILTASHYHTIRSKMERVLELYKGIFEWNDVIIAARKGMIRGDILIDDNFDNCHQFTISNHGKTALMRDRPYNINRYNESVQINSIRTFSDVEALEEMLETLIQLKLSK